MGCRILFVVVLVLVLSACANAPIRLPADTTRIGIVTSFPSNDLCFHYRGLFVWQNELKRYTLAKDFGPRFLEAAARAAAEAGLELVSVSPTEITGSPSDWLQVSGWDNRASVAPEAIGAYRALMSSNNFGALLVHERAVRSADPDTAAPCVIHYAPWAEYVYKVQFGSFFVLSPEGTHMTWLPIGMKPGELGDLIGQKDLEERHLEFAVEGILADTRTKFSSIGKE